MSSTIKICGLSTADTLAAALEAGADMVGFVFFEKSPRFVGLDHARALGEMARGEAKIVALSVDPSDHMLAAIVRALAPDFLQLHGSESPERVAEIRAIFPRSRPSASRTPMISHGRKLTMRSPTGC
jgi:phosphoribosylanthranilate isomerase